MMKKFLTKNLISEKGFTLIELLVVISIIGVLATIAIPRFTNTLTAANTAKIQADLKALNTAVIMYQSQNGTYPSNVSTDLNDFIVDIANLKPPTGNAFLRDGTTIEITDTAYSLATDGTQALCQGKSLTEFGRKD